MVSPQASSQNESLYNSDWTEMPIATRKMIIILMTFGQNPPVLEVSPFYVINRKALAGVRLFHINYIMICHCL